MKDIMEKKRRPRTLRRTYKAKEDNVLLSGISIGIFAGIAFLAAAMLFNVMLGRSMMGPPRLVASIALGTEVLNPSYSLMRAFGVGGLLHFGLSVIYGIIFMGVVNIYRPFSLQRTEGVVAGVIYGTVLWIVNFFMIAPVLFPQFLTLNMFWHGFVTHALIFGTIMGWLASRVK